MHAGHRGEGLFVLGDHGLEVFVISYQFAAQLALAERARGKEEGKALRADKLCPLQRHVIILLRRPE
jgi:hypothetical protein